MTSPSLLSRESTTLSPRWPQNGHFIGVGYLLLACGGGKRLEAAKTETVLGHEDRSQDDDRDERHRVEHDCGGHRCLIRGTEERRDPDTVRLVKTADATRRWDGHAD